MKPTITQLLALIDLMGWEVILPPIGDSDSVSGLVCGTPEYVKSIMPDEKISGGFGPVQP